MRYGVEGHLSMTRGTRFLSAGSWISTLRPKVAAVGTSPELTKQPPIIVKCPLNTRQRCTQTPQVESRNGTRALVLLARICKKTRHRLFLQGATIRLSHHSSTSPFLGLCMRTILSQFSKHRGSNAFLIYRRKVSKNTICIPNYMYVPVS